ncbi:MAG: polyphenol oxidase family protein [Coriobacteriia bacterium]|nr:polyphenol oxidase family protein [Coriobacteriia bacterium]
MPELVRHAESSIAFWRDDELLACSGVTVAFSERTGGVSEPPFASLNLGAHVGDDFAAVEENRSRLLSALGLGGLHPRLTCAQQVHGMRVESVGDALEGSGGSALPGSRPPVAETDALLTTLPDTPLMLFFADCVPIVLVRPSVPAVAVVHAGWRGALAGIAGKATRVLSAIAGEDDTVAYIGPHIGACCYEVSDDLVSQFRNTFVTLTPANGRLDLGAAVAEDLVRAGVPMERQKRHGMCTADNIDRFFSYRAEGGLTGRHCAVAAIAGASF